MRNAIQRTPIKTRRVAGVLFLLAAIAAAFAAQTALASGPTIPARHTGGYVPANGAARAPASSQDLTYHGGPVMRVNKTYAIYWIPAGYSVSANYKSLIDRYYTDVAAASGANTNVYSVETQYSDTTGPIAYSSTFGGSTTDTNPFPANGYPSCGGPSKCLSDGQLQTEINNVIAAKGWVKSLTTEFFIFTPQNVGSCDSPGSCSYTVFCAYHGYGSGNLIYANQPYAAVSGCNTDHPNGDDADATINVASHEHREAINDEHLNAWYDDFTGEEGSDQCAWNFGTALGGGTGTHYNQVINGHHYCLQQEWSNDGSTCLLQYGSGGPAGADGDVVQSDERPGGDECLDYGDELHGSHRCDVQRRLRDDVPVRLRHERHRRRPGRRDDGPDRGHDAERHRYELDELHRHGWWRVASDGDVVHADERPGRDERDDQRHELHRRHVGQVQRHRRDELHGELDREDHGDGSGRRDDGQDRGDERQRDRHERRLVHGDHLERSPEDHELHADAGVPRHDRDDQRNELHGRDVREARNDGGHLHGQLVDEDHGDHAEHAPLRQLQVVGHDTGRDGDESRHVPVPVAELDTHLAGGASSEASPLSPVGSGRVP